MLYEYWSTQTTEHFHLIAHGITLMPAHVLLKGRCLLNNRWTNHSGHFLYKVNNRQII